MRQTALALFFVAMLGCGSGGGSPVTGQPDASGSGGSAMPDSGNPGTGGAGVDAPAGTGGTSADAPVADLPAADMSASDSGPAPDVAGDKGGADMGGLPPGLKALMITNPGAITPGDVIMRDRMRALGFVVTTASDAAVTTNQAAAMDLVVISSSAESAPLGAKVRDVTIPVVSIENGEYSIMRMTGTTLNTDSGMITGQTSVVIKMPGHELAAGLTGTIKISTMTGEIGWGVPGPAAIVIATTAENPNHIAIFAYEKGAMMVGGTAPARRVGYAIREALAANLTPEGGKLFDAAVTWAMGK